jgi:hypothetical protein
MDAKRFTTALANDTIWVSTDVLFVRGANHTGGIINYLRSVVRGKLLYPPETGAKLPPPLIVNVDEALLLVR